MARGINKVILVGNLGQDPDMRSTPGGVPVTNVSLATTRGWKDRQTGENREQTEWHRIVFFNRLAEVANQYLHKGSKVYIEGELRTRNWERDGQKHYTTEVVAREMQMLDSRGDMQPSSSQSSDSYSSGESSGTSSGPSVSSQGDFKAPAEDYDDDIPF